MNTITRQLHQDRIRIPAHQLLDGGYGCTSCEENVTAWDDQADGIWWECGCDAGYVWAEYVTVLTRED